MAGYRPAGLSDEDSDSDDYGFYEKPSRSYYQPPEQNAKKVMEMKLQDAIINGNLGVVKEIITLDLHNSVNFKLDSGWTPLMHACFHAQQKIVKYLLEQGADPNYHADSVTPIMVVCSNSSASNDAVYNIVLDLIDKDAFLNIGDKYGQTPLMRAISSGRVEVVKKLLDMKVNIEMRDQQGWTALFWAAHHNQPEILEILIGQGARLTEVDKSNRNPMEIAASHGYDNIIVILKNHLNIQEKDEGDEYSFTDQVESWREFYPGARNGGGRPTYVSQIPHLLYGMNCENLTPIIMKSGMDLRTFLLLEEEDMIKMGIDMPYERQRLKYGLHKFHKRGWTLSAVAGLYARRAPTFTVLDCLTTLGTHLLQTYILEATLQYTLREYNRIKDQIKFEPPDSPVVGKLETATKKLVTNINTIRGEMKNMKRVLSKISRANPYPANLIKEKSAKDLVIGYISEAAIVCSLGFLVYQAKNALTAFLKK